MAKAKAAPRCKHREGHAEASEARATLMANEVERVGRQYAALLADRGPRCQHPHESPDARNSRLMEAHAEVVSRLTWERDEAIQRYIQIERIEVQIRDEYRKRKATFVKKEQAEWKRVWEEVDLWLRQQGVPDPAVFYRERKAELEALRSK